MMPEGKTMYTVADLIEHLKWANPKATVSTSVGGDHHYLSMDGASNDNVILLFAPRHEFNDITEYYQCPKCGRVRLEEQNMCGKCGYKHVKKIVKRATDNITPCTDGHEFVEWEVKEDPICKKCGICASEV